MFHSVLHKNLGLTPEDKSYRQAYLILSTLSVVVCVLTFYILYNLIVTRFYHIMTLEIISLCFAYLSWYLLVKKQNISLSSTILVMTIFVLTLLFIFDQKHNDYALAQAVMLPVLAIYLKGLRQGLFYSLIYVAAILSIAFAGIDTWDPVPFTTTSFTNLFFTYAVVILLIYYFEFSRVEAFNIIQKSHQELEDYKNRLEEKVEEALKEKRQQEQILIQQSKMALMGEMIASIAHQWKQPLAITTAVINTARFQDEFSKQYAKETNEVFDKVLEQVEYMDQTISDFSGFFKPNREKEFFSLSKSIDDVYKILLPQFEREKIRIENSVPAEIFMVEGYRNEFSQVLLNILSNAKDAICENIRNERLVPGEGKITIKADFANNKILLSVCDNGGGIPENLIHSIFDPYFTTKPEEIGSGIGLYMSKMIMDTHMKGSITAENTSEGACLMLQLKAVQRLA